MKKILLLLSILTSAVYAQKIRVESELTMAGMTGQQTLLLEDGQHTHAEFGSIELEGWVTAAGDLAEVGLIVSLLTPQGKKELSRETIVVAWQETATFVCPSKDMPSTILKITPYRV